MLNESRPLRVLMVAPFYTSSPRGGIAMHIYQVGPRLVRAGVDVTILALDLHGELPAAEESEGMHILRVRAWPSNMDYYFAPGIFHVIADGNWDLVHCQGYNSLIPPIAMLAALRAHIPYVLSLHSAGDVSRFRKSVRGIQRMMLRPLLSRAEKLIAVSEFEAASFRDQLRLPASQFAIISNGAGHLPATLEADEDLDAAEGVNKSPLILSIGRLVRYKGHQRVIAAMPKVLEQVPDARLRIVGVGPYEETLQKMAAKLGVAERVEIGEAPVAPGDRNGMASLFARANLVTLLSEHEGQGIAVLEALTFKRPVLVAGTSALQEFADRGLARSVPLDSNSDEIAAAIIEQLRHPLIPMQVELPTWDDCAANILILYRTILPRYQYQYVS
jgi:glycosyltransferase involved in cell wall biosynthesis